MRFETLDYELVGGVARVTLARPDSANAVDLAMARELMAVAIRCDEDREVRAVRLGARGKMFCAGGDLRSFGSAGDALPAFLKELTTHLHAALSRFARMRAPVVAAVGGMAAGAGMSLACAADLIVAAESARFTMAYTRAGLTPDGSSTWHLPRRIGAGRSLELMLTNRVLGAAEALAWGLVTQVVPDAQLDQAADRLAAELAAGPTEAFGAVKRLVLESAGNGLETQLELEARAIADAARTADGQEGVAAFLAKRNPRFRGA